MTIELNTANIRQTVSTIETIAPVLGRYGLVLVIAWIGALKFTAYAAQGTQPLVANSPFMSSPSCSPHPAWVKPQPAGFRCCRRPANSSSKTLRCWACQPGRWPTLFAQLRNV
jgi:hypothetical protein